MDFFRFGHGEKALVILPGLSVDSVMKYADAVADAYRLLTDDFTIYVFDRRKELPSSYSETEMAEDTAEAIRLLGLEQACIFGASQGGTIAIIIAARYPHPRKSIRIISGFLRNGSSWPKKETRKSCTWHSGKRSFRRMCLNSPGISWRLPRNP